MKLERLNVASKIKKFLNPRIIYDFLKNVLTLDALKYLIISNYRTKILYPCV